MLDPPRLSARRGAPRHGVAVGQADEARLGELAVAHDAARPDRRPDALLDPFLDAGACPAEAVAIADALHHQIDVDGPLEARHPPHERCQPLLGLEARLGPDGDVRQRRLGVLVEERCVPLRGQGRRRRGRIEGFLRRLAVRASASSPSRGASPGAAASPATAVAPTALLAMPVWT